MFLPRDFREACRLLRRAPWLLRPFVLLILAAQTVVLVCFVVGQREGIVWGMVAFCTGLVPILLDYFIRRPRGEAADIHSRVLVALVVSGLGTLFLAIPVAAVALLVGLFREFDVRLLTVSLVILGVFGLLGFVSTLIRPRPAGSADQPTN